MLLCEMFLKNKEPHSDKFSEFVVHTARGIKKTCLLLCQVHKWNTTRKLGQFFLVKCLIKNRMFSFSLELLIRAIPENIVEYS